MVQRLVTTVDMSWLPEDARDGYELMRAHLRKAQRDLEIAFNVVSCTPWPRTDQLRGQIEYGETWTKEQEQKENPNTETIKAANARLATLRKALRQAEAEEERSARELQNKMAFDRAMVMMLRAMATYEQLVAVCWKRKWMPEIGEEVNAEVRKEFPLEDAPKEGVAG